MGQLPGTSIGELILSRANNSVTRFREKPENFENRKLKPRLMFAEICEKNYYPNL